MDHISNNLNKYSSLKAKTDELSIVKDNITKITNIEPESIRIKNNTLYIKAKNNYEAVELRMCRLSIQSKLEKFLSIRIVS